MKYTGNLGKMRTEIGNPISYYINFEEGELPMHDLINHSIQFTFSGKINCIACGNTTNKSFANGFCYPCMMNSPMNSECIIRPELCKAHLGEGRDMEWEKKNHLQEHVAYLALSSGLKIGVTRASQVPTRWIDQGAWKAIKLAETPNRYYAGAIEHQLKQFISDKTHWQKMLRNIKAAAIDLRAKKDELHNMLSEDLQGFYSEDQTITELHYPVKQYPLKVVSTGFDKAPKISGILKGIKGQYLIFEDNRVLNIRKHNGYHVQLEF